MMLILRQDPFILWCVWGERLLNFLVIVARLVIAHISNRMIFLCDEKINIVISTNQVASNTIKKAEGSECIRCLLSLDLVTDIDNRQAQSRYKRK